MMSVALIFAVTACGSAGDRTEESSSSGQNAPERTAAEAKGLVVYFSWSGNTENVANSIKDQIGSDIFEIVPQTPYSDDFDTVVDLAREEQRTDARPEISGSIGIRKKNLCRAEHRKRQMRSCSHRIILIFWGSHITPVTPLLLM